MGVIVGSSTNKSGQQKQRIQQGVGHMLITAYNFFDEMEDLTDNQMMAIQRDMEEVLLRRFKDYEIITPK